MEPLALMVDRLYTKLMWAAFAAITVTAIVAEASPHCAVMVALA